MPLDEFEAIDRFFEGYSYYCGGPIPSDILKDKDNVNLLRMPLFDAIDIAHQTIDRTPVLAKTRYKSHIGQKLIPKIIHSCEKRNIRREMIGGLMLLYLEIVEGCDWRPLVTNRSKCEKAESN